MPQQPSSSSVNNADQLMRWTGNATAAFPDNTSAANQFAMMPSHPQGQPQYPTAPQASGALARRGANNALVPAAHTFDQPADSWSSFADDALVANPTGAPADETDNVEVLEERAQRAKREAQAKRKQIPPFVQKLNR